jgi:hypothetical protein
MIKLDDQSVILHLSDEGRRVLRQTGWDLPEASAVRFEVQGTSDQGLWVKLDAAGRQYVVMIRWEYVVSVVVDIGEIKTEDLVN